MNSTRTTSPNPNATRAAFDAAAHRARMGSTLLSQIYAAIDPSRYETNDGSPDTERITQFVTLLTGKRSRTPRTGSHASEGRAEAIRRFGPAPDTQT